MSLKLAKCITRTGGVGAHGPPRHAIETDADGNAVAVRHVARRAGDNEERIAARVVMANCAPSVAASLMATPARAKMEEVFGSRPLSTSLYSANFGLSAKPATVGVNDFLTIIMPSSMKRFDQYGDGGDRDGGDAQRRIAAARHLEFHRRRFQGFGTSRRSCSACSASIASTIGTVFRRTKASRAASPGSTRYRRGSKSDYPGFSSLVTSRMLLNAYSMSSYLNTPEGAVYGFAPLPPDEPILMGFPRTPDTPIGGLYLASAFGGEHGFNGAMLSGAEAARLASRRLEATTEG